ncbi:ABC-F family ATP-binding cassette domain-containing protein [Rhizosphaericola mali]|uniref:ABC-F family ATP-binding cassette domain-containing protein n=1 Tax=Rhizosphaericola mali TaxID=2545455 RepID=A0A5P2FZR6_9BACT|nr:ABC-F family ATP-binding cassette domain-containing protein [Rhizosphaericola mali]QES88457.1 ABC-F family ATP-binding cassette domain-containing protein [Rhizosphaericola mali]
MHYVSVENISKSFGITPCFNNLSFNINEGEKIAIIARNGEGKTTMLRILAGEDTPDSGKIWINKEVTVAFFEQEPHFEEEKTVIENILHAKHPVVEAIKAYEHAMETEDIDGISNMISEIESLNAWDFEAKVKQILGKLNIHNLNDVVGKLSGGQRKRVALARILIDIGLEPKHIFLIMDEPTNHLDVGMVEWLENYLNQENITLLLVTHDRYFLDEVTNTIWELENSKIYIYKGDYQNYLEKKAERIDSESATIDKAKNEFRKELEWMRKQPRARGTKSKARQDNFYEIEAVAKQKIVDDQVQLDMKMNRLGGKIIELKKVYKSFGEKSILKGFDYTFSRGERVGVIGKNGVGKSTFVNILQELEPIDSGKINVGETIVFGNFSQKGLEVKENMRVIEYVKSFAESFPLAKGGSLSASQFLELFLFTPDKQYTFLDKLSGGEKKRLQLLTILFKNPNFLILDEPTNDLDLPTLAVLERFLSEYQGCVLIVSHDRYFMDKLVNHLFVFEGEGEIRDFPGNYSQYRVWEKQQEDLKKLEASNTTVIEKKIVTKDPEAPKKKASYNEKKEFDSLERELKKLNSEKTEIESKLADATLAFEDVNSLSLRIGEINNAIDEKELRWLELSELF